MGVNYDSLPTTIYTTWNWDKINWTGNNSGDACNLFDTDGDGNANYSLCVVVKGSPAVLESTILYSCSDTRPDRCQGASSLSTTASCSVSVENDDPFTYGEEYPKDTVAKCTIPMADFSTAGAYLLDVCSYPSSQPNSDPSDCIIAQQQNGLISVIKDVVPNNDNTNWVFNISGKTNHVEYIRGDGFTGSLVSELGTYSITETAGDNTNISLYTTTWACTKNGEAYLNGSGTVINNLNLGKSGKTPDTIVCKFTNTLKEGYLTVKKIVNGSQESPSTFSFKVNNGNDIQFENDGQNDLVILPGTYNIVENSNSYHTTTYDNCSNLEISNGETETCTITNTLKESSLTVIKEVRNNNGGTKLPSDFNLYINGVSAISGQAYTLPAGNYTVTEDGDNGYSATFSGACDSDGKVTLNPGDDKTCVITNDDISPELTVIKKVVNDDGGNLQPSDFAMQVSGTHVSKPSFEGSDFPGVTVTLDAGNYSVDEINHDGYSKSLGTDCSGTISVGEKKTCIITNDDIAPTLTVIKTVFNDNGGTLTENDFHLKVGDIEVISGVTNTFKAGKYTLTETPTDAYTSSGW